MDVQVRRSHITSKDGLTRIEYDGNSIGIINHLQPASGSATVLELVPECVALKIALSMSLPEPAGFVFQRAECVGEVEVQWRIAYGLSFVVAA
jgi:hypothetical protein